MSEPSPMAPKRSSFPTRSLGAFFVRTDPTATYPYTEDVPTGGSRFVRLCFGRLLGFGLRLCSREQVDALLFELPGFEIWTGTQSGNLRRSIRSRKHEGITFLQLSPLLNSLAQVIVR